MNPTTGDFPNDERRTARLRQDDALERLSAAFAQLAGPPAAMGPVAADDGASPPSHAVDEPGNVSPRSVLEALLFVGHPQNAPLAVEQATEVMRGVSADDVAQLVAELNAQYEADGCPYRIAARGGGYAMELHPAFDRLRSVFEARQRHARLSPAAVEVLSLVAYNQPISADEIDDLRGAASAAVLAQLVRRGLLRVERRPEQPRKPRYATAGRFLEILGLASLDDLPRSQEIDER